VFVYIHIYIYMQYKNILPFKKFAFINIENSTKFSDFSMFIIFKSYSCKYILLELLSEFESQLLTTFTKHCFVVTSVVEILIIFTLQFLWTLFFIFTLECEHFLSILYIFIIITLYHNNNYTVAEVLLSIGCFHLNSLWKKARKKNW